MIKTIDLDKLSKEEKDKVASDISGGVKQTAKEKEERGTWVVTPLALIKAKDILCVYIEAKREGLNGYHVYASVKTLEGTGSYPIKLGIFSKPSEAQDLLNEVYEQIKEVI